MIARIGDEPVYLSELVMEHSALPQQYQQIPMQQIFPQLVTRMIERRLMSKEAARIFFYCLDAPMNPARFVEHESGNVAKAEAALIEMSDEELRELLNGATVNE